MPKHPNWWKTNTDGWFPGGERRQQGLSFLPLPRRAVWFRWAEGGGQGSKRTQTGSFISRLEHMSSTSRILGQQPRGLWSPPERHCGQKRDPETQGWATALQTISLVEAGSVGSDTFKSLSQTVELSAESGNHRPESCVRKLEALGAKGLLSTSHRIFSSPSCGSVLAVSSLLT